MDDQRLLVVIILQIDAQNQAQRAMKFLAEEIATTAARAVASKSEKKKPTTTPNTHPFLLSPLSLSNNNNNSQDRFYELSNPERENLCLYGNPDATWEVDLPAEEVPPELPEPALGINFARNGMARADWLALVAVHSDTWLLAVAFYNGARLNKEGRERLFDMINELPTCYEVVSGKAADVGDGGGRRRRREQWCWGAGERSRARRRRRRARRRRRRPPLEGAEGERGGDDGGRGGQRGGDGKGRRRQRRRRRRGDRGVRRRRGRPLPQLRARVRRGRVLDRVRLLRRVVRRGVRGDDAGQGAEDGQVEVPRLLE